jgi:hypothetical protein
MPQKRKAASEILREISETRKARLKEPTLTVVDEWEEIDLVAISYRIIESNHVQAAAILNYPIGTSLLDVFMSFVTVPLLQSIWQGFEYNPLKSTHHSLLFGGEFELSKIYQFLAIQIRIIGEHNQHKMKFSSKLKLSECRRFHPEYQFKQWIPSVH